MLTREDLQAISELIHSEVTASEERMMQRMDQRIAESEERTNQRIAESEERTNQRIIESENRTKTSIMAYIESSVRPDIRKIAEGHMQLAERMERMEHKIDTLQNDVDEIKGELVAQELVLTNRFPAPSDDGKARKVRKGA